MSTALQSRMIHFSLTASPKEWVQWAVDNDIDSRVIAYVEYTPTSLDSFDPTHQDKTFCCARTLEFLSDLMKNLPKGTAPSAYSNLPLYAGTIGEGAATEFRAFLDIYKDLITFDMVAANPLTAPVSSEPSALFALTGVLAENINSTNIVNVMQYVLRMPIEHQVSTIRKTMAKSPMLASDPAFISWLDVNAKNLM